MQQEQTIVERLRRCCSYGLGDLIDEAANEIERLNARISELEADDGGFSFEEMEEAIAQMSGVSPLQRGPVPQGPFTVDL